MADCPQTAKIRLAKEHQRAERRAFEQATGLRVADDGTIRPVLRRGVETAPAADRRSA